MAAVMLKGGLFVAEEAVVLAIALEGAGITLTATDGVLTAAPRSALTAAQIAAIRQWKRHLLSIAAYEPPQVEP